ncbi:hypothetical protein F933_01116, partial [Acinetobacter beijerinckii CIP 110307]
MGLNQTLKSINIISLHYVKALFDLFQSDNKTGNITGI